MAAPPSEVGINPGRGPSVEGGSVCRWKRKQQRLIGWWWGWGGVGGEGEGRGFIFAITI